MLDLFGGPSEAPLYARIGAGLVGGAVGAVVGTPADLAMVRMMADRRLPVDQRRNYRNAFDALVQIVRHEGFFALWKGVTPTLVRAMSLNAGQLVSYGATKRRLLETDMFQDGALTHFAASLVSGFVATVAALPFDVAKTRIQQQTHPTQYRGLVDCMTKLVRAEGARALWTGFVPAYVEWSPRHACCRVAVLPCRRVYVKGGV